MSTDQLLRIVLELTSPLLALISGLATLKKMRTFFRIIFFQVVLWVCFYSISYVVTIYQTAKGLELNNQWLMNINMIAEGSLLFTAGLLFFRNRAMKTLIVAGLAAFLLIAVGQGIVKGVDNYFNYADVAECILMTALFSAVLLSTLVNKNEESRRPVLLLSSGLLLYFACSIPLISLLNILWENEPDTAGLIFEVVNHTLANIRYLLTALAFFALRRASIH